MARQVKSKISQDEDNLDYYLSIAQKFHLILDPEEAKDFISGMEGSYGVDLETLGLSPIAGEEIVRLTILYNEDMPGPVILDHFFCGTFTEVSKMLVRAPVHYFVYNAKFETKFFDAYSGGEQFDFTDVDFMAKVYLGGGPSSLATMAKRDLSVELDKGLQLSDWSVRKLTRNQYIYGALDGVITFALAKYWSDRLSDTQFDAIPVLNDTVRPTIEAEATGLVLNVDYHEKNCDLWDMKQALMLSRLKKMTPPGAISNYNSKQQVGAFLKSVLDADSIAAWPVTGKTKAMALGSDVIKPIAATSPYPLSRWLVAYMRYNYYTKYTSTYGRTLITKQLMAGRILSRFNIAAAATIRYSSSNTNLQNIPRKTSVRKAFVSRDLVRIPYGRGQHVVVPQRLVMADYSGIELRVLAEITKDEQLLRDVIYGNVHSASASAIYRIPEKEFQAILDDYGHRLYRNYKEKRSVAKGFSFQLTYGAMAPALSLVLKCSVADAEAAIRAWAERYPRAYAYRTIQFGHMQAEGFLPTWDGRTIYVRRADRTMPVAANYGIQSAAASVMNRAMHHVYQTRNYYEQMQHAEASMQAMFNRKHTRIAATVHDELLMYAPGPIADIIKEKVLVPGMVQGWLDIFPNTSTHRLIESKVGTSWADKP